MENVNTNNTAIILNDDGSTNWDATLGALGISTKKLLKTKTSTWSMPEWIKGWIALIPALIFLILFSEFTKFIYLLITPSFVIYYFFKLFKFNI